MGWLMATAKHKVSVSWREELVGDEKDSMSFYLRLTPRFKDKGEVFDVKAFLAEIKKQYFFEVDITHYF